MCVSHWHHVGPQWYSWKLLILRPFVKKGWLWIEIAS